MSKEIKDKAREYLQAGLSVIPTKEDKQPPLPSWKQYQSQRIKEEEVEALFSGGNVKGLAVICGAISGGLEVIDVDTKYDTTGSLWEDLRSLIEGNLPELYTKLVIARTMNGGYHIYYRCSSIAGNNPNLAKKKNKEVLIETRGEGGYVVAPPTPKYSYIQGEPTNITTITPEEREILFSIAKSFTEIEEEEPKVKTTTSSTTNNSTGLSTFEDYNLRGDVEALLERKGWTVAQKINDRKNVLRPGETKTKSSGNFLISKKLLRIWSSSTVFETDRAYNPSQVYTLLEHNGDNSKAAKELYRLGYGDRYEKNTTDAKEVKTELIKVEVVNSVNRETSIISNIGDSLKIENIKAATGEEVVITSPGPEAQEEVLRAIDLILQTGKRIYIKEGATEMREYRYQLLSIFDKYGTIQEESGVLSDRERDNLLDEVVILSTKLQPLDKDLFLKDFIGLEPIKELGISEESLSITVDRLTSTRDKEAQAKALKELLFDANKLQEKGQTDKALDLIENNIKEVKLKGVEVLLPPPISFTKIAEDIASLPPAYKTGYSSLDSFIGFTPGAITLIAGRPSHGKTSFMFNLLLEMSKLYKDESFYFFTYEEPVKNIAVKLLNRLTATDLSGYFREVRDLGKPNNYEFLKNYIKASRTDIKEIEEGKRQLQELIDSQRIKIIDRNYSVEELSSLIAYLKKREQIGALFIDYIQRMRTDAKTQDMRTKIAHISDSVLQIAKESDLPIILGAQLNRATLDSKGGKPKLENLKEAGNLEEDANTVLSVYNESREKDDTSEGESYRGLREVELEIKALKNREGEVNQTALLTFDKWTGVITSSNK